MVPQGQQQLSHVHHHKCFTLCIVTNAEAIWSPPTWVKKLLNVTFLRVFAETNFVLAKSIVICSSTTLGPPNKTSMTSAKAFWSVWYDNPMLLSNALTRNRAIDDEKTRKNRGMRDRFHILAAIVARWPRPVASVVALDPLRRAMCMVSCWRTTTSDKMVG